jgi:dolichol kinase
MGPVSLGLGAILVLAIFPLPTAAIAIYALAFGDGFASLLGKPFGRIKPAFLLGKSVEGSLACFLAVFYCTWSVSRSLSVSLGVALTATMVEALPLDDFDNIAIPLAVALVVTLI